MKHLIALVAVVLVGCMPPPKTIVVPQEVKVAVPVSCIKAEDIPEEPEYAMDGLDKADSVDRKGAAAIEEVEQRRTWQRLVKIALKQCTK